MLRLVTFVLLLLTLSACGQKGAVTNAKFTISGIAADTASGSVLFTAFNPTTQMIFRVKMEKDSQSFELPDGEWVFSVVYWNLTDTESSTEVRCGLSKAVLEGKELSIDLQLSEANCRTADFNEPQFLEVGNLQSLQLNQCASFGVPTSNCDATPGVARSFRMVFPAILVSPIDKPAVEDSAASIDNGCLEIAANDGTEGFNTMLPSGTANAPIPFLIRTYTGPSCTGDETVHNFTHGLLSADNGSLRVHDFDSTTDVTRILVRSGSLIPLHASVSLPAESTYKFNLSNFVTGGTPPYTFTLSSAIGTLTGTIFSGDGTPQSATVSVVDANSINSNFVLNTVIATHHTIFENAAAMTSKWTVTRSTSQLSMNAPGVLSLVSANVPRFLNTQSLGSPTIDADKYLIIEKNSTSNILTNPTSYIAGTWVSTGFSVSNLGMSGISTSHNHFSLNKTATTSASVYQDLGNRVGNHVASVYLKEGTSSIAGLRLENISGTCTGLVVNLQSGATTAMSGCPLLNTGPGLHGAQYIGGGWWRVWVTRQFISGTNGLFKIYPAWNTSLSATEDPTLLGSVLSFMPQLEAADRPLFPMVTSATARGDEYATMVSPGSINLTTGTFLLDWHSREPEPNKKLMSFCSGATELMNISIASGKPQVVFAAGPSTVQETSLQDTTLESQNRIAFKLSAGSATLYKRNNSTPVTTASGMSAGTPAQAFLGRGCTTTPIHNLGARRFGYWTTVFEDIVLKEMSNDSN